MTLSADSLCPFCGIGGAVAFARADGQMIAQCGECRCLFVARRASEESVGKQYATYWSGTQRRAFTPELARWLLASAAARVAIDPWVLRVGALLGGLEGRRVLDVGCGFGEKAVVFRAAGAEVIGVDPSGEAARFARGQLSLDVRTGSVEAVGGDVRFDAALLFDVVEHPAEPMRLLAAAAERLRPGGILVLLTPNGTAGERVLRRGGVWEGFLRDMEHLQYLHVDTVQWIAERLGMRVVHLEQLGHFAREGASPGTGGDAGPRWGLAAPLRRGIKAIPGARRAIHAVRVRQMLRASVAAHATLRSGDYHLFAALELPG